MKRKKFNITPGITIEQSSEGRNITRRLWLVRHGLTDWNTKQRFCGHSDIPLSEKGRVQATWLAERLQKENISDVYTSDLVRARETAEIIANKRTPAVQISELAAWREIDFGDWEGLTYSQIVEQYKDQLGFFSDPEQHAPPNGESLAHLQQRVKDALLAIVYRDDSQVVGDVVIVSHGGPLRVLLCNVLEMAVQNQWRLRLDHGSLSAIDLLPDHGFSEPRAILALLNVLSSMSTDSAAKSSVSGESSENRREQGTMMDG